MISNLSRADTASAGAGSDEMHTRSPSPQRRQSPPPPGARRWHPEHIAFLAVGIVLAIAIVAAAYVLRNWW